MINFRLRTGARGSLTMALWFGSIAFGSDYTILETTDYREVQTAERELASHVGGSQVLIVLDLDNTTLKTRTDFASEQWFLWQADLLKAGVTKLPAISPTIEGVLAAQGMMLKVSPMEPVDPEIPNIIRGFQAQGAAVIVLTSRNPDLRDATIRELARNGIRLSTNEELKVDLPAVPYWPYDLNRLGQSGLTAADVTKLNLPAPKAVIYDRGVMLTDGQHKGAMLRTFLAHAKRHFSGILFVDDRTKHHDAMRDAFENVQVHFTSAHYTKTAAHNDAFTKGSKIFVNQQWCAFTRGLEQSVYIGIKPAMINSCH